MKLDLFGDPIVRMKWFIAAMCAGAILIPVLAMKGMLWFCNRWADRLSKESSDTWLTASVMRPAERAVWSIFVFITLLLYGYSRTGGARAGLMSLVDLTGTFHFLGYSFHTPTFEILGLPWASTELVFLVIALGWIALPLRLYLLSQIKKKRVSG